jgi:hypothetical protein
VQALPRAERRARPRRGDAVSITTVTRAACSDLSGLAEGCGPTPRCTHSRAYGRLHGTAAVHRRYAGENRGAPFPDRPTRITSPRGSSGFGRRAIHLPRWLPHRTRRRPSTAFVLAPAHPRDARTQTGLPLRAMDHTGSAGPSFVATATEALTRPVPLQVVHWTGLQTNPPLSEAFPLPWQRWQMRVPLQTGH